MPKRKTAIIGKIEARVTTPKPPPSDSPLETIRQTPIPKAKTRGTVTGPVVTAQKAQARPIIGTRNSLK